METFRLGERSVAFLKEAVPGGPAGAADVSELRGMKASGSADFVLPVYFGNLGEYGDWEYDDKKRAEVLRPETVFSVMVTIVFEVFANHGAKKTHRILFCSFPQQRRNSSMSTWNGSCRLYAGSFGPSSAWWSHTICEISAGTRVKHAQYRMPMARSGR